MSIKNTKDHREGRFYTPECFAAKAHEYMAAALGTDWTERYVVWDCACGEKALTKALKFKELYCSTLEQYELDNTADLNPEATCFQFDFLNDYIPNAEDLFPTETKLPESLMRAIRAKRPLLFLINPPYATSSVYSTQGGNHKKGTSATLTNAAMKAAGFGAASANLYAQFLYRILTLKR